MNRTPPWQIVTGIGAAVMMLGSAAKFGFEILVDDIADELRDVKKMVEANTERSKQSEARWLEQDILFPDAYRKARREYAEDAD